MSGLKELLAAKESELASAQESVRNWEAHDAVRDSGSMAQDQRHEESGQRRRERVRDLLDEIQEIRARLEQEGTQAK
ncbi:hypothetical protein [Aeromonas sp. MrichA-1]|uniref:hypothetical protein n=1 Tax=Aeromonas sp. MrichA-1 TaxID=2823362 RepID=UPI001B33BE8D|nr:hypothetical protein [Aeromonas sp. MrichA-1]MBP4081844.1 hypothetical protein [Aeromonas sp. MrichA-1]